MCQLLYPPPIVRARKFLSRSGTESCGIGLGGEGREKFLADYSRDVREMNSLASVVLDAAAEFGQGSIIISSEKGRDTDLLRTRVQLYLLGFGNEGSPGSYGE